MQRSCAVLALVATLGCNVERAADETPRGNVLLVIADDVGQDMLGAYGWHPDSPPTPTLDALAARGVLFENAYANPWCSPTRATILTGRYGFRTGLGVPLSDEREPGLRADEMTLPELLRAQGGASALIGKWHLGAEEDGVCDPRRHGFDHFRGTSGNLLPRTTYESYFKIEDGEQRVSTRYATSEQVDDALELIAGAREPWFVELCFNAAHQPFHAPPRELHTAELSGDPEASPREHYFAAVEALDRELGRLLASLDRRVLERTTVIFVGDNGSPNEVVTPPVVRKLAKGTLFEAGVRVPLVIAGRGVAARGRCSALVNTVDLFPTIAELLGLELESLARERVLDGVSLCEQLRALDAPARRRWAYSEVFWPNGPGPYASVERVIRDERWKLMVSSNGAERFFDLHERVLEIDFAWPRALDGEERRAYEKLRVELDALSGG